ncbi:hypothetical protein GF386_05290 [Candidatus Pacearchaeota archaeon]|nr:hypothetical protein [Candidatus Pacearchaeota archaeon]
MARSGIIPVRWDKESKKDLDDLAEILNLTATFGKYPATLKFAVHYCLKDIQRVARVIPDLKPSQLRMLLAVVERQKISNKKAEKPGKTLGFSGMVIPDF